MLQNGKRRQRQKWLEVKFRPVYLTLATGKRELQNNLAWHLLRQKNYIGRWYRLPNWGKHASGGPGQDRPNFQSFWPSNGPRCCGKGHWLEPGFGPRRNFSHYLGSSWSGHLCHLNPGLCGLLLMLEVMHHNWTNHYHCWSWNCKELVKNLPVQKPTFGKGHSCRWFTPYGFRGLWGCHQTGGTISPGTCAGASWGSFEQFSVVNNKQANKN